MGEMKEGFMQKWGEWGKISKRKGSGDIILR